MRSLVLAAIMGALGSSVAVAQRHDLERCPCGPDWIVGADRALVPQGWHGADFRPACADHDACLEGQCINRRQCDLQFRSNLLAACRNSHRPLQCRLISRLMYRAVRSYRNRELTPADKARAIAFLRRANARLGRDPYPGRS